IIRTVAVPSGSRAVPRLLSTNSPWRWSDCGSTISTLLEGCNEPAIPVTTMIAIMTPSMAAITTSQRFSVRETISSGMMPSGSGSSGVEGASANGASRQEEEEIEGEPAGEQQPDRDGGDGECAGRPIPQRLPRFVRCDQRGDVIARMGRCAMLLACRHLVTPFAA